MFLENASPFIRMIVGSVVGIFIGIVLGLLFGILIAVTSATVSSILGSGNFWRTPDYEVASFAGMGLGAIVGSILGGIAANKK